jgi:hypothetical protein
VAQTRVELAPGTTLDRRIFAGLLLWRDEQHFARLELRSLTTDPGRLSVHLEACVGGQFRLIGRGQCARGPMWLRLERAGNALRGLCSGDGEEWLLCGQLCLPRGPAEQIGLAAIENWSRSCAWFDTLLLWRERGD